MHKTYLNIFFRLSFEIVLAVVLFGVVIPYLISAKSTLFLVLGVGVLWCYFYYLFAFAIRALIPRTTTIGSEKK